MHAAQRPHAKLAIAGDMGTVGPRLTRAARLLKTAQNLERRDSLSHFKMDSLNAVSFGARARKSACAALSGALLYIHSAVNCKRNAFSLFYLYSLRTTIKFKSICV